MEAIGGDYIDSKSNRAVGEKNCQKSNNASQRCCPIANIGLNDECIFSASELAVGDQPMISLNCIGSIYERSWSESRKMLSVGMDRRFQIYHWFNQ
jgi:hypothetical protein